MRVCDKGYLLGLHIINRDAYYGEDMEMAVWVDRKGVIQYYYFIEICMPRYLEVLLA